MGVSSSSRLVGLRLVAFWIFVFFAFAGVLHSSPSSSSVVHAEEETSAAADVVVAPAEEEETELTNNKDVCAPAVVMDCSKHEQTIAELTESLEALQRTLDAHVKESRDELSLQQRQSQQECQARLDDLQVAHRAELAAAVDKNTKSDKKVKDARVSQLQAQLDAAQDEAVKWQKQHEDVTKEHEKLRLQHEETHSQLRSLQKEHDRVVQENQKLAASVRDVEQRAAGARQAEAKRKRDLDKERERAKARLEASQSELFETRRELHDVWERYVAIRDAWWNVPSRWEAVVAWATLQWDRFDAQVDRILVVVKPHVERCGRIITTTIETIHRKFSWFVNVLNLAINDWFLPNWRLHVQPHLDRTGRFCAAHARELGAMANEQRIAATAWAVKEWSTLMTATAPQREQLTTLLQPTVDMLRAQFGPAWTTLRNFWTAAFESVAESTWLEATAVALYRAEHHVVSAVATATGVARDYLALQNAPNAATQPLQWIHQQAAAHAAASTAGASAGVPPPPQFLRNVLMTATTATALILTVLWLLASKKRPSSSPRRRPRQPPPPSSPPPPYRTTPTQVGHKPSRNNNNNNNKPASPDLLTEASSIPDGSLRTPVTRPR